MSARYKLMNVQFLNRQGKSNSIRGYGERGVIFLPIFSGLILFYECLAPLPSMQMNKPIKPLRSFYSFKRKRKTERFMSLNIETESGSKIKGALEHPGTRSPKTFYVICSVIDFFLLIHAISNFSFYFSSRCENFFELQRSDKDRGIADDEE